MIYFRKEKPRDYKYPILEYYLHYPASLSIFLSGIYEWF